MKPMPMRMYCALAAGMVMLLMTFRFEVALAANGRVPTIKQVDWEMLLPVGERGRDVHTPPPPIHDYLGEGSPAALQLGSYTVNPELDGAWVRIPGFVVPLRTESDGTIVEFLLVPYFGACIHVPPPPPNQIVYVRMKGPGGPKTMMDAVWLTGRMSTKVSRSDLASAAYTLEAEHVEPYQFGSH